MGTRNRAVAFAVLVALATVGPVRADYLDVATETLDDGWTRYTYTLTQRDHDLLRSFTLEGDAFEDVRNLSQPTDYIGYTHEGGVSWARDARHASQYRCPNLLEFSFESQNKPGEVGYTLNYTCVLVTNKTVGPTTGEGEITGVKTPEPSALCLLAIGGAACWWRRRKSTGETPVPPNVSGGTGVSPVGLHGSGDENALIA